MDKVSRGWWLRAIQEYGTGGSPKISIRDRFSEQTGITLSDIVDAFSWLKTEGLITALGDAGNLSYVVSADGRTYMDDNRDEWEEQWKASNEIDESPAPRRFTVPESPVFKPGVKLQDNGKVRVTPPRKIPSNAVAASIPEQMKRPPTLATMQTEYREWTGQDDSGVSAAGPTAPTGETEAIRPPEATPAPENVDAMPAVAAALSTRTKDRVRDVMADMLIERFGDQITAKEVWERL